VVDGTILTAVELSLRAKHGSPSAKNPTRIAFEAGRVRDGSAKMGQLTCDKPRQEVILPIGAVYEWATPRPRSFSGVSELCHQELFTWSPEYTCWLLVFLVCPA